MENNFASIEHKLIPNSATVEVEQSERSCEHQDDGGLTGPKRKEKRGQRKTEAGLLMGEVGNQQHSGKESGRGGAVNVEFSRTFSL